jgi:ribulose-5-phosphate 4-epimerase/fuculose-1-phosphate aldolase
VSDLSLAAAVSAAEEFEDAARLMFLVRGHACETLSDADVAMLRNHFGSI